MFKKGKKTLCIFTLFNKQTVRKSSLIDFTKKKKKPSLKKISFFTEQDGWETNQA